MLDLALGLLFVAGIACAINAKSRFLAAYFLITPVFVVASMIVALVLSGWLTHGIDHQRQASIIQAAFVMSVAIGVLIGLLVASWVNRRMKL